MNVLISDARYTNAETGATTTSSVYHLKEGGCSNTPTLHAKEVDEAIAQAFGRTLCGLCEAAQRRRQRLLEVERTIKRLLNADLQAIANVLPQEYEVRIVYHDPDRSSPSKVWSSR